MSINKTIQYNDQDSHKKQEEVTCKRIPRDEDFLKKLHLEIFF